MTTCNFTSPNIYLLCLVIEKTYLQSTTVRLEEWRVKRTDTEQWMRHRQLPSELKENVRRYDLYKWVTTHGVDEEAILKGLPLDIRRDIKRHLCVDLVRRVSFIFHPFISLWLKLDQNIRKIIF